MKQNITVYMRDGTTKKFNHQGRRDGSFTKTIKYEGGFAIITDEYSRTTAIPSELIAEVRTETQRW